MATVITRTLVNSNEDVVIRPTIEVPIPAALAHGCVTSTLSKEVLKCHIMARDDLGRNYGFAPIVAHGTEQVEACSVADLLSGVTKAVLEEIRVNQNGICLQYRDETGWPVKLHRSASGVDLGEFRQQILVFHGQQLVRTYVYVDYGFEVGRCELYAFARCGRNDRLMWKRTYKIVAGAKRVRSYRELTIEEYTY